jgi:peroxiredoxin
MMNKDIQTPDWSKLPMPEDDGAARHLPGERLVSLGLPATDGSVVDLAALPGKAVVFIYPRTGRPDVPNPDGWDLIPGARGCNSQACSFRDLFAELKSLGVGHLFGLSTQDISWQRDTAERLHLPFPILSDESLRLSRAMRFPLFETSGMILLKRMTLVLQNGVIERVFYPIFPPDQNAAEVAAYLRSQIGSSFLASS